MDFRSLSARRYGAVVVAVPTAEAHIDGVAALRKRLHEEGDRATARMALIPNGIPWAPAQASERLPAALLEHGWRHDPQRGIERLLDYRQHQFLLTPLLDDGWHDFAGQALTATLVLWMFVLASSAVEARARLDAWGIDDPRTGAGPIDILEWPF